MKYKYQPEGTKLIFEWTYSEQFIYVWIEHDTPQQKRNDVPLDAIDVGESPPENREAFIVRCQQWIRELR